MLVVVAPGQGSQSPGFLTPWLEIPGVRERLEWLSVVSGVDLVEHGTVSDAETIRDTAIAQPLIVGAGLVTLLSLFPHPGNAFARIGAGAGHSVGEITAAVGAGVLTAEQAMVFVRERGRQMAAAAAVTPTGMSAVLGGDPDVVVAKATEHGLTAANMNGAGQIVVAGTLEQLAAFAADPPEGARVRPLEVAGAFHTEHMAPAVERARRLRPRDDDARSAHPAHLERRRPRRPRRTRRAEATRLPGQQPGALGPRACRRWPTSASPRSSRSRPPAPSPAWSSARSPVSRRSRSRRPTTSRPPGSSSTSTAAPPTWRTSPPGACSWRRSRARSGSASTPCPATRSRSNATVGTVETLRDTIPVVAPHGGTVVEWLVEDGDPVAPGQPIVRLHPIAQEAHA